MFRVPPVDRQPGRVSKTIQQRGLFIFHPKGNAANVAQVDRNGVSEDMRAKKTDSNQQEILNDLKRLGISYFVASGVGAGFPDIVVGFRGLNWFIEIKTETGKQTKPQIKFEESWQGQYAICRSTEQVLEVIGAKTEIERLANIAREQT